jgi:hypothetical protein
MQAVLRVPPNLKPAAITTELKRAFNKLFSVYGTSKFEVKIKCG